MTGTKHPAARRRGALAAGLAGAALALAGGGYALHAAAEDSGYRDGYTAGHGAGERQTLARYDRGTPAYRAIYVRGQASGRKQGERAGERQGERVGERAGERHGEQVGFEHGRQVGLARGEQDGAAAGAQAALGGFGDWQEGEYYVVSVQPGGQAGVPYRIATRTTVEPLTDYRLCERNESKLCSLPVVVASGG